ncbi:MAG: iron-sulfur cluster assembly scaffold protein [Rhodospirillaceae bacterium]|nr:iron-sulfur cluster assembly scaffold protein [Rhodospirillaceae bacterium]
MVDYAQRVEACALGQAVASIIADRVIGQTRAEVDAAHAALAGMIHERTPPPNGHWAPLAALEAAADIPTRHASVLLPFEALAAAMRQADEPPQDH